MKAIRLYSIPADEMIVPVGMPFGPAPDPKLAIDCLGTIADALEDSILIPPSAEDGILDQWELRFPETDFNLTIYGLLRSDLRQFEI